MKSSASLAKNSWASEIRKQSRNPRSQSDRWVMGSLWWKGFVEKICL